MSLSRLLLVAASSKKYIREGEDRIEVKPKDSTLRGDPFAGEVVLCFQLDDRKEDYEKRRLISRSLDLQDTDQRCDGLIFYAQDGQEEKVICLVEMKHSQLGGTASQIKSTKDHIKQILHKECEPHCNKLLNHIKWKACFYHHGASIEDIGNELKQLRRDGFDEYDAFTKSNNNVGPLLRGEGDMNARNLVRKYKQKK